MRTLFLLLFAVLPSRSAIAQNLDPRDLLNPLGSSWPTYNGDYSGRRFSQLSQITAANVRNLSSEFNSVQQTPQSRPCMFQTRTNRNPLLRPTGVVG